MQLKKLVVWVLFALPHPLLAQTTGVIFEKGLSWQQVKEKAKTEHKFIFVDFFATWCGPCRQMDAEVYPNDTLGTEMNKAFISVKVQIDTTKGDIENVKSWYGDAYRMRQRYAIMEYPTFLFFSPDGEIIHREMGYLKAGDFRKVIDDAVNPGKQYYTLIHRFRARQLDKALMPGLVNNARRFHNEGFADTVAREYIQGFLMKLSTVDLYQKDPIDFLVDNIQTINSTDQAFEIFLRNPVKIDTLMHSKGLAGSVVRSVVYREELTPYLNKAAQNKTGLDWEQIDKRITVRFGEELSTQLIITAKTSWYRKQQDWKNYTKYLVEKINRYGPESKQPMLMFMSYNNNAWYVFQYSQNVAELKSALAWADKAIMLGISTERAIDTKAELLYKLGRKKEGLDLERKILKSKPADKTTLEAIAKMEKNLPTWPAITTTN